MSGPGEGAMLAESGHEPAATAGPSAAASPGGLLVSRALVLNRSFLPIQVTSIRRACTMLYAGIAKAVDGEYQTFDFPAWLARGPRSGEESVGLVSGRMAAPRVVVLLWYDRVPRRTLRFTRQNIYARDQHTCQYCARRLPKQMLNLDHVVPRSQGGESSWENVVCSCHTCNRRKGGRTPEQCGIRLLRRPFRPVWSPFGAGPRHDERYREWQPFLPGGGGT